MVVSQDDGGEKTSMRGECKAELYPDREMKSMKWRMCAYDWKLVTVPQPLGLWLCTVLVNDLGKSGPLRVSDNVVSTHISRVTWYSY